MTGTMRAVMAALVSTGAHLALAGGLAALSRAGSLPAIVVDLSAPDLSAPAPSAPARVAPSPASGAAPRAARAPASPAAPPSAPAAQRPASAAYPPVHVEPEPETVSVAAELRRELPLTTIAKPSAAPSTAPATLPTPPGPAPDVAGAPAASTTGPSTGSLSGPRGGGEQATPSAPAMAVTRPGEARVGAPPEYAAYLTRFRQGVQAGLTYPMAARRRGLAGTVELEVSIDPQGRVRDVRVSASSSHAILDEAAAEAVRRLPPLPFPSGLPPRALTVRLPLVFALQ